MKGILLTGPIGVGKSMVQRTLCEQHGFWTPRTCTTRLVGLEEAGLVHIPQTDFLRGVRSGEIVFPALFGSAWYGWFRSNLDLLHTDEGRAVLNVRPYAALVLQSLLKGFVAIWLTVDEPELLRRRAKRLAPRDVDNSLRALREEQDRRDLDFEPCFTHVWVADDNIVPRLLELIS